MEQYYEQEDIERDYVKYVSPILDKIENKIEDNAEFYNIEVESDAEFNDYSTFYNAPVFDITFTIIVNETMSDEALAEFGDEIANFIESLKLIDKCYPVDIDEKGNIILYGKYTVKYEDNSPDYDGDYDLWK